MENITNDSSNPLSVCEKIFKAISTNPFRSATPAIEHSCSIVSSTPVIRCSRSILRCRQHEVLNKKDKDLVPLNLERPITIQIGGEGPTIQSDMPQMLIQQSFQKREPAQMYGDTVKDNNRKLKAEKTQSTKTVVEKENDNVAVQHTSVDELPTSIEAKPKQPGLSVHDRLKSKELVSHPIKVVLEQIHTERANSTQKSGRGTTTHVIEDQENFKSNIGKDSSVSEFKYDKRKDRKGEESHKSILYTNSNDKFSDYINRTKQKIRATLDVGNGDDTPRVDSMDKKVNGFIHHAKYKIRTSSSNNGGSWSFK